MIFLEEKPIFFVFGCTKCHAIGSIRVCQSRPPGKKPKSYACFFCHKSRRVLNEQPLFAGDNFFEVTKWVKDYKLKLLQERMN